LCGKSRGIVFRELSLQQSNPVQAFRSKIFDRYEEGFADCRRQPSLLQVRGPL